MSRIRVVGGSITKTSKGATTIEVLDGNFVSIAAKQNMWNGGENGVTHHEYVAPEKKEEKPTDEDDETAVVYETDGHYSTVYLVCLMLGMKEADAEELAIATEAPDTTIHDETDFELNDTWIDPDYQGPIHSLTGGFHGIEEFMTAIKFLWLKIDNKNREGSIKELGELLHRFGDTYAHSKLDNIKPENLFSFDLYSGDKNLNLAIDSWKGKGGKVLADDVEPWIQYINFYTKKYSYKFLTNEDYQREAFAGKTLKEVLKDVYLLKPTDKFKMYGGGYFTTDHKFADDGYPDHIYIRPDWYLNYVKNLAWLLAKKFNLDLNKFSIGVFEKMTKFATNNKCSLKGIIDYEIAKKRGKKEVFIPVFYSRPKRVAASTDAALLSDYLQSAKDAKEYTTKYMMYEGDYPSPLEGEEITDLLRVKFSLQTKNFFYYTTAYKLKF